MGRLIDEANVFEVMKHHWLSGSIAHHIIDDIRTDIIKNVPTVEAIPKADYEEQIKINNKLVNDNEQLRAYITMMQADYKARLKADMIAMLVSLNNEIDDLRAYDDIETVDKCEEIIQKKINTLKGDV